MQNVISAVSTAKGVGGVAIIRLSGEGVFSIVEKMFKPLQKISVKDFEPYKLYVGEIDGGDFKDFGMCVIFKAPKSYTGEDMAEFHCHGGVAITEGILKRTFYYGAEPATRGEFTKRAFVNGKLSLDSAEGLIGMINSESAAAVKISYNLYREKLYNAINRVQDELTYSLASIDADIDYPEEGLEEIALDKVISALNGAKDEISGLIKRYGGAKLVKNGVKVAIVGKPNTGKSSLLNSLLSLDKAIVSNVPGTTRDVVEGSTEISGVKFDFYDTAGIREAADEIEKIGIDRSRKILNSADVIIAAFDLSRAEDNEDKEILGLIKDRNAVKVYNKSDAALKSGDIKNDGIIISCKTGEGLEKLKNELYARAFGEGVDLNAELITEERHLIALKKAEKYVDEALLNVGAAPLDLIGEDIKKVWSTLGEITGKVASEDIIDEIFSKFCVGK